MSWLAISYETRENPQWSQLLPIEVDKRLTDPAKIKADLANRQAKRAEAAREHPFMAQFAIGSLWGDKTPVTTLMKASDAFKVISKYEHILVDDPSLYMRMGLLEVFEGQKDVDNLHLVADELRFGLMEGRCIDPSRLLFGTQLDHEKVALRLGMTAAATLTQSTSGDERLKAWLNVLKAIGERIWG